MSDGGRSGKAAAEFPIIYFTVAKIWQVFGKAEWMFRLFKSFSWDKTTGCNAKLIISVITARSFWPNLPVFTLLAVRKIGLFLAISLKVISATSFIAIGAWALLNPFLKPDQRLFIR
ncbi:MAG: hypothetical protein IPH45_02465 [Bacteroidales bacterium]|nr:hypothetical protein [Bacteroidales bacterium]